MRHEHGQREPEHSEIATLAYYIWKNRDPANGNDISNWLAAENILRNPTDAATAKTARSFIEQFRERKEMAERLNTGEPSAKKDNTV